MELEVVLGASHVVVDKLGVQDAGFRVHEVEEL